jgi:hypothetical protein
MAWLAHEKKKKNVTWGGHGKNVTSVSLFLKKMFDTIFGDISNPILEDILEAAITRRSEASLHCFLHCSRPPPAPLALISPSLKPLINLPDTP